VSAAEFLKVFKSAGESTVITLTGLPEETQVLVHEVTEHPVTSAFEHIDFYAIEKGKKVEVSVPVVFTGVAPAIKELGAQLVKVLHEIEIEALPNNLPHEIVVDLGTLMAIGDQIYVRDITPPTGVTFITDGDDAIVIAQEAKEEEEEAPALDMSAIEVEKKGKEETDGEGEK
jgi:large subunit ribosomal protein L25